jgi:large subunit ribosomal protein L2
MALKQYKPTSPGQRGLVLVDKSSLSKDRPMKKLTEGLPSKSGRNNNGRTVWSNKQGISKNLGRSKSKHLV